MLHAWGMTETSPMCTVAHAPPGLDVDEQWAIRATQGRAVPFVELRLVDDAGQEVAWDGSSTGEIEVRGPWIASAYYRRTTRRSSIAAGCAPATSRTSTRRAGSRSPTARRT